MRFFMNTVRNLGYVFAFLGVGIFAVTLFNDAAIWTESVRDGAMVLFSFGMAVLLSAMSFAFGMEREEEKVK